MAKVSAASIAFPVLCLLLAAAAAADPTAYDVIQMYGFPAGIIPKGVTHYNLDKSTGKFDGYFNGTCSFALEGSYQLRYDSQITGYIRENKLTNLSGVSVKLIFIWVNIVEVKRTEDKLEFSVGIASAGFPIDGFKESPQCGCGFNCKSVDENLGEGNPNPRSNSYVSDV